MNEAEMLAIASRPRICRLDHGRPLDEFDVRQLAWTLRLDEIDRPWLISLRAVLPAKAATNRRYRETHLEQERAGSRRRAQASRERRKAARMGA